MENSRFLKTWKYYSSAIWSSISNPGYISEKNENTHSKRYMHLNANSGIIYNRQDMKAI